MMYAGPYAESNHRKIKDFRRTLVREHGRFRRPHGAGQLEPDSKTQGRAATKLGWFLKPFDQATAR